MSYVRSRPAALEVRSIDYVPQAERRGGSSGLWPIWFTGSTHLTTMAVGIIGISLGAGLFWTALAILAGSALGTLIISGHAAQGPRLGLPQLIQARSQFGYYGALLVYGVALISYVGYNAFGQILAGQTLHALADVPMTGGELAYSGVAIIIAIVGYRLFQLVQRWLAYGLIAALGLYTLGLIMTVPLASPILIGGGFKLAPFVVQLTAAAAYQLSWSIYVSDYSRYLPRSVSAKSAYWWTFGGVYVGGSWGMLIGAVTAALVPGVSMAEALVQAGNTLWPGFGPLLLGTALLGLTTGAALNFYGASLTLLSIVDTLKPMTPSLNKRIAAMLTVGAASTILALTASNNFIGFFATFLSALLHLVVPWIAVTLVDFYLVRRGRYAISAILRPSAFYGRWNWRGIAAYGLGFLGMIPFLDTAFYVGPIARALQGIDVGMLVGMIISAVVYRLLCLSLDVAGEWRQIRRLDQALDAPLSSSVLPS
jgi:purine-cytosine permease-like protein